MMMQFKQKLAYIASGCVILLSGVVLLISVWAQAPKQAQIVFVSDRDGNGEIYAMDVDGKNQHNLTIHPAEDWFPAWSPDGQRIAFHSKRDGNFDIYIMDANGQNEHRLTNNPAWDGRPDWFDPAYAYAVFPGCELKSTWGKIKRGLLSH